MSAQRLGTIFVELDIDSKEFTKRDKEILKKSRKTTLTIEDNWRTLGSKSDRLFKAQKQSFENAYNGIKHSGKNTAEEIIRAEKIKNKKISELQKKQFGEQKSLIQNMKSNWLGLAATVTGIYFTISKGLDVAKQTAQLKQSRQAFRTMVEGMGRDADVEFSKIKRLSGGLIDEKTLIESSNRAISLGIPVEKLGDLMLVARAKARDMGITTQQAFNDIATGVGRASPLIIDNLGLAIKVGQANQNMAKQLGKTVAALTDKEKKTAILNATLDAGTEALKRHNLSLKTEKERLDASKVATENLKIALGDLLLPAYLGLAKGSTVLINELLETKKGMDSVSSAAGKASVNIFKLQKRISEQKGFDPFKEVGGVIFSEPGKESKKPSVKKQTKGVSGGFDFPRISVAGIKETTSTFGALGSKIEENKFRLLDFTQTFIKTNAEIIKEQESVNSRIIKLDENLATKKQKEMDFISDYSKKIHDATAKEESKIQSENQKANLTFNKKLRDEELAEIVAAQKAKAATITSFNQTFSELGKDRFQIERDRLKTEVELWKKAGIDKEQIARVTQSKITDINKKESEARLLLTQNTTGQMANSFLLLAKQSGDYARLAFAAHKAFAIAETVISAHLAASKALGQLGVFGPPVAAVLYAAAIARVGAITSVGAPPGFDNGGISNAKGIYQTGNIAEAHIPLKNGKVPVQLDDTETGIVERLQPINVNVDTGTLVSFTLAISKDGTKVVHENGIERDF